MSCRLTFTIALFFCSCACASVSAAQLVSNLSESYDVGFGIQTPANATAGSFTTGLSAATLGSIEVKLQGNSIGSSEMRLRADSGSGPGAVLESLGTDAVGVGQSQHTYLSSGIILSPLTTYWVTLGETGSGDIQWDGTFSTADVSSSFWSIGNQTFQSQTQGATWQQANFGPPNSAPLFAINATLVPEPSTLALAGIGAFALFTVVARRRIAC